jgi:acyl dehydratase
MSATCAETPRRRVTAELVREVVEVGGYTHPLFRPADPAAAAEVPLPGQGVLLLAGGLVEQSGLLGDAVAMLGMEQVSFAAMVRAGDEIRVRLTPGAQRRSRSGRTVQEFDWEVLADDRRVARATAVMLMEKAVEELTP